MIVGVGNHQIDVRRIERALARFGDCVIQRVFTGDEQERAPAQANRAAFYAQRFAAKQACARALGAGVRDRIRWRDISVTDLPSGRPAISLSGGAMSRLRDLLPEGHEARIDLTLTDDFPLAGAIVIISGRPEKGDRR